MGAIEAVFVDIYGVAAMGNRIIPSTVKTIGEQHFDAVGFGIAMGNAIESLKARVYAIVDAALESGFKEGMHHFVLHNIMERQT